LIRKRRVSIHARRDRRRSFCVDPVSPPMSSAHDYLERPHSSIATGSGRIETVLEDPSAPAVTSQYDPMCFELRIHWRQRFDTMLDPMSGTPSPRVTTWTPWRNATSGPNHQSRMSAAKCQTIDFIGAGERAAIFGPRCRLTPASACGTVPQIKSIPALERLYAE